MSSELRHVFTIFMKTAVSFMFFFSVACFAQAKQYITIVNSTDAVQEQTITKRIKTNITALLRGKQNYVFRTVNINNNATFARKKLNQLQRDSTTDIIITTGIVASQQLANIKKYNKPSIAGVILDENLQRLPSSLYGRSGVKNFTYIKPQFDIAADLHTFQKLYPYSKLGVIADASLTLERPSLKKALKKYTKKPFKVFYVNQDNFKKQIQEAKKQVDALYVLPLFTFNAFQLSDFFTSVNAEKLPSFAMYGRQYTQAGALASLSNANYTEVHARRIALDVLKIVEGQSAASLPINLPRIDSDFVVNMKTAKQLNIVPSYQLLQQANVINRFAASKLSRNITFTDALKIALNKNVAIQKTKKDIEFAQTEISEAKRAFLPSLEVSYQATKVDEDFRLTQGAGITETLKATASQVLFSDQAISLYKARKLAVNANLEALKRAEYQLVYDVLSGFVQHFNAKRQVEIQQENTHRTQKTLEVARRKNRVGYAGKLDVYRLESELAINQANLDKAVAGFRQSELVLKKLLNIPLNSDVNFIEITDPTRLLSVGHTPLFKDLNNQRKTQLFTEYLINVAIKNRPAIIQYDLNIEAQQKIADSEKRKWYMPTIALAANANHKVARHELVPGRGNPTLQPKWDISLVASLPLFDRQQMTTNQKNAINIEKLKLEKQDLVKNIQLGLSSDMQTAIASYRQMVLFETSAQSAKKNFDLVENLYKYGRSNITNLIDAQNNVLSARLNAINAAQQFFIDYLKVEQQSGFYYFLASQKEQQAFLKGFTNFVQDYTVDNNAELDQALADLNWVNPNSVAVSSDEVYRFKPALDQINPELKKIKQDTMTDNQEESQLLYKPLTQKNGVLK